jgi:hypothetical protein
MRAAKRKSEEEVYDASDEEDPAVTEKQLTYGEKTIKRLRAEIGQLEAKRDRETGHLSRLDQVELKDKKSQLQEYDEAVTEVLAERMQGLWRGPG